MGHIKITPPFIFIAISVKSVCVVFFISLRQLKHDQMNHIKIKKYAKFTKIDVNLTKLTWLVNNK